MTFLLLAGFGSGVSGCLLHLVLGIGRRPNWKHLAFAATMFFLCAYFIYERRFYAAATVDDGIRVARNQLWSVAGYLGALGWFIQRYTDTRFPRAVVWGFYALLAASLVYNQLAPFALYYSVRPTLHTVTVLGGEPIHILAAPMGLVPLLWYLLSVALQLTGVVCGLKLMRRARLSGAIFSIAVALPLVTVLIDLAHELLHADWPYSTEYGVVGMATVLSVQLAVDYRSQEAALARAFAGLEKHAARMSLFAELTPLLSGSLDYERVLDNLAHLCVRNLADWCTIDVIEGGRLRRSSAAHADPQKVPLLRSLIEHFPADFPGSPNATVVATKQSQLWCSPSAADVRAMCASDEHYAAAQELGVGSRITVPLLARNQVLGVLSFVSKSPGRYRQEDQLVAEELASRAALAIDNARLYRLEHESVRVRDEFLTAVSHELRTPVASLVLSVQSMLAGPEAWSRRARQALELIDRQGKRLTRLINDMMSVARVQLDHRQLLLTETDLAVVARDVSARMQPILSQAGCVLELRVDEPTRGTWDRDKLEQVMTNLLSNAAKFGAGKPIEVHVGHQGGLAEIVVIDHGIGMNAESIPRIFDKFERGEEALPYGGLGLGLYFARNMVEALGGQIDASCTPGHETRFRVVLPLAGPVAS